MLGAVWTRAGKELAWLALVSIFTLIVWLYIAVLLFAVFYGPNSPSVQSVWQLVDEALTTPRGVLFLVAGNGVGAVIALIVFSFTAFSPPLVVDRDVDFVTAMATSLRAVAASPRAMLAWAIVVGADLVISFATFFVALLVIFPVLSYKASGASIAASSFEPRSSGSGKSSSLIARQAAPSSSSNLASTQRPEECGKPEAAERDRKGTR